MSRGTHLSAKKVVRGLERLCQMDSVSLLTGNGIALDGAAPLPLREHPPSGRSNRIESLCRVEGTTASARILSCVIGVCREASGLQVLLENGIEDEKASAGCPQTIASCLWTDPE